MAPPCLHGRRASLYSTRPRPPLLAMALASFLSRRLSSCFCTSPRASASAPLAGAPASLLHAPSPAAVAPASRQVPASRPHDFVCAVSCSSPRAPTLQGRPPAAHCCRSSPPPPPCVARQLPLADAALGPHRALLSTSASASHGHECHQQQFQGVPVAESLAALLHLVSDPARRSHASRCPQLRRRSSSSMSPPQASPCLARPPCQVSATAAASPARNQPPASRPCCC
nr:protein transport protein sec31-like [Aegilops tauschii subsp. strangulata]